MSDSINNNSLNITELFKFDGNIEVEYVRYDRQNELADSQILLAFTVNNDKAQVRTFRFDHILEHDVSALIKLGSLTIRHVRTGTELIEDFYELLNSEGKVLISCKFSKDISVTG